MEIGTRDWFRITKKPGRTSATPVHPLGWLALFGVILAPQLAWLALLAWPQMPLAALLAVIAGLALSGVLSRVSAIRHRSITIDLRN